MLPLLKSDIYYYKFLILPHILSLLLSVSYLKMLTWLKLSQVSAVCVVSIIRIFQISSTAINVGDSLKQHGQLCYCVNSCKLMIRWTALMQKTVSGSFWTILLATTLYLQCCRKLGAIHQFYQKLFTTKTAKVKQILYH